MPPSFTKHLPFFGKHSPPPRPLSEPTPYFRGFEVVNPDNTFKTGQLGGADWKFGQNQRHVPYIQAEGTLPFVDIPAKLAELSHHCWKFASVSPGVQRGPVQIGAIGPANFPFNSRGPNGGDYKKEVRPIDVGFDIMRERAEWRGMASKFERVNAYTFRGEVGRSPAVVEAAGGFRPPVTRTDNQYVGSYIFPQFQSYMKRRLGLDLTREQFDRVYNQTVVAPHDRATLAGYFCWRALVEKESHHIDAHVEDQVLKNYISTTKYVPVAKKFAGRGGWVYVTRVRGGFHLNSGMCKATDKANKEQEIALPGVLAWADVFGFRQINNRYDFEGPLYLRRGFRGVNPVAYQEVLELMSGKTQA